MTACGQHDGPAAPGMVDQLPGQPGLTDPGFALDQGEAAIGPGGRMSVDERRQLIRPPDQWELG